MEGLSRCVGRARKEKVTEDALRCSVNVILMRKLLRSERCWHEPEPCGWWCFHIWFHCSSLRNRIESTFLCNPHQNRRFFFFLKLHLIEGQWSATQTSTGLTSTPGGLGPLLVALLPSEALELGSDLMPANLKWEAVNVQPHTGQLSRSTPVVSSAPPLVRQQRPDVAWNHFQAHVEQMCAGWHLPRCFRLPRWREHSSADCDVWEDHLFAGWSKQPRFSPGRWTWNVIYPSGSCWSLRMWWHMCGKAETLLYWFIWFFGWSWTEDSSTSCQRLKV